MSAKSSVAKNEPDVPPKNDPHTEQDKQALHDRFDNDLTLHPPKSANVGGVMDRVRQLFLDTGHAVIDDTPACRQQSLALSALEEACRHSIAAIACNQDQYA